MHRFLAPRPGVMATVRIMAGAGLGMTSIQLPCHSRFNPQRGSGARNDRYWGRKRETGDGGRKLVTGVTGGVRLWIYVAPESAKLQVL